MAVYVGVFALMADPDETSVHYKNFIATCKHMRGMDEW